VAVLDREVAALKSNGVDQATIDRALVKMRSNLYDNLTGLYGFGRADLLASFALFDDNPERINTLEAEFKKVTPALIKTTAEEYLRLMNRTILTVDPLAPTQNK
jgi:predicted Zn-dependent peptidase